VQGFALVRMRHALSGIAPKSFRKTLSTSPWLRGCVGLANVPNAFTDARFGWEGRGPQPWHL